jgi:sulfide dehydrogenase cytochrome subunit
VKFRSALAFLNALLLLAYSASSTLAEEQAVSEAGHAPLGSTAALAVSCSGCHREGGRAIVSLEGLSADDIEARFLMYRSSTVGDSAMHRMARGYTEEQIRLIADYLGRKP